jgi:phosphatidylglycerophosphatase B
LWCSLAFALTASGGPGGFFVLLLVTSLFYAISAVTLKEKALVFAKSIVILVAFFGILAFVNERFTKPLLKAQRPSHVYMLNQAGLNHLIDSLYELDKEGRERYFSELVRNHPLEFKKIDPGVQAHWIEESGFSFPSGHTFNAFLFAMVLAYAILFNRSYPGLKKLYFIPFVWALLVGVSRVAIGAHSAIDVSAGAAMGIFLGMLFLYFENTRHWLTRK